MSENDREQRARILELEEELAVYKTRKERFAIFTDEDVAYVIEANKRLSAEEQSSREGLNHQRRINQGLESRIVALEADRHLVRAAVAAYDEANPLRTADVHALTCNCLRCCVDRLRVVK